MPLRYCSVAAFALLAAPLAAQTLEARNAAMGGAGTASARYVSAGFFNPALLTRFREDDDWGLLLPSIGVFTSDYLVIDDVDNYQNAVDGFGSALDNNSATPAQRQDVGDQLNDLIGKDIFISAGAGAALSFPSKSLGVSVFVATRVEAQAITEVDPNDQGVIGSATSSADLMNLQSTAAVLGIAVAEAGIALAHEFDFGPSQLSVGVTPKFQRIATYQYRDALTTIDFDDADNERYRNEEDAFNVDAGLAWSFAESFTIGLVGRNLVSREVDTQPAFGMTRRYVLDPTVTLGGAYRGEVVTLTADFDLTETPRFQNVKDESRFVRVGGELDAWDWLQIRAGYGVDLEDTVPDLFTAGLGISPFDTVHLDIAGLFGSGETIGGAIQLALTF